MATRDLVVVYGDYGRDKNGKRIRKKFTGSDELEARLKKAEYEREHAFGIQRYSDRLTVREWAEIWQSAYKASLKGTNKVSYDIYIKRLCDEIGAMKMRDVRHIHLYRSLMGMEDMSKSSLTKYRMVIQQIFKKARQNKVISDDPSEELELPTGTSGSHRALEKWEIDLILANWQAHYSGLWMMLMLLAGLRRGEMIALDWENVDMKNRMISVCQAAEIVRNVAVVKDTTKTEAGVRLVPICDPLFAALDSIPKDKRKGPVCTGAKGARLTQSSFSNGMHTFNAAMERILNEEKPIQTGRRTDIRPIDAGSRKPFCIRAHDLRHTFCTLLFESGVDVKSAAYFMGHSDVRVTMEVYTHLTKEKKIQSGEMIAGYLASFKKDE